MTTGEKLREFRKKEGLTQKDLAEKVDVTTGVVAEWESDELVLSEEKLDEIVKILTKTNEYQPEDQGELIEYSQSSEAAKTIKKNPKKIIKRVSVSLIVLISIIAVSIGIWFFVRTPDERNVDLQLKGTTWKSVHVQIGSDYIDMESDFMSKSEGALLEATFYPIVDYVKLTFRNGTEIFPYRVTDFDAAVIDDDFYDWSICFYDDNVLLINTGSLNYFFKIK